MESVKRVSFEQDFNDVDRNAKHCKNGCQKYNKSVDEIVQAASKHREAVVALKSIGENQKTKITGYKDQVVKMQAQIDKLEFENDAEKELVARLTDENRVLQEKLIISRESESKIFSIGEELKLEISNL